MVENVFNVFKEIQMGQKWVRIGKDPEKYYTMFAKSKVGLAKQYWPDEVPFEDMTINQALKTGFDFVCFDPANPFVDEVFERLGDCLVFNHFKKCPGSFFDRQIPFVAVRSRDAVMVRSFVHWEEAGKSFARLKKLEVNVFMGAGIGVRSWMSEFVDLTK